MNINWKRPSECSLGDCVEVTVVEEVVGTFVLVRDSSLPENAPLCFTAEEWGAFLVGVKAGEFDIDDLERMP